MTSHYFDPPPPRLFGHRGDSANYPENTLPAFQSAVDAGMAYLELDIWTSRDGCIVVHHDPDLSRLCGVAQEVCDLTLEQIRSFDAGYNFRSGEEDQFPFRGKGIRIATLEEVLVEFPQTRINIEIKQSDPPLEESLVKLIRDCRAEQRVLIASEKDDVLQRIRPLCPGIPTNLGYTETATFFNWLQKGCPEPFQTAGNALQIPAQYQGQPLVFAASVKAAHRLGLEIHVWTINEPDQMRTLLDCGIDGLMSDDPKLLAQVVKTGLKM
jgi:glycerophosphoryl diester phosphodiesterase